MRKVFVYQIGYGTFGKFGFERLLQLAKKYDFIEFRGLAEINPEKRELAKKKAEEYGIKINVWSHTFKLYKDALSLKGKVVIYDATPPELHYAHLLKSIECGFWHFTEKPPCLTKEEFEKELKLPQAWDCDFIEEENEVILTTINFLKRRKLKISSIEIFRESSIGLQKILGIDTRVGVKGGCLLDKACHETYILSFLNACKQKIKRVELRDVKADYLMIDSLEKDNFIDIFGRITNRLTREVATAQSKVEFLIESEDRKIPVKLHVGWLGISEEGRKISEKLKKTTNYEFIRKKQVEGMKIPYEDLRLFILKCDFTKLYGELKGKKLFASMNGKYREVKLLKFEGDQLYRQLKKFIFSAIKGKFIRTERMKFIMNIIFEARKKIEESFKKKEEKEEIEKTKNRVKNYLRMLKLKN